MFEVILLICAGHYGSATILEDGRYITAAHVAEHGDCNLGPIHHIDQSRDFAIGTTTTPGFVKFSCEPVTPNQRYVATGFSRKIKSTWRTSAVSRTYSWRGSVFSALRGGLTEGMSGGPVYNPGGEVVAIINARNDHFRHTLVQPLKDTALC